MKISKFHFVNGVKYEKSLLRTLQPFENLEGFYHFEEKKLHKTFYFEFVILETCIMTSELYFYK